MKSSGYVFLKWTLFWFRYEILFDETLRTAEQEDDTLVNFDGRLSFYKFLFITPLNKELAWENRINQFFHIYAKNKT